MHNNASLQKYLHILIISDTIQKNTNIPNRKENTMETQKSNVTVLAVDTGNHSMKTPNTVFRASLIRDAGNLEGDRLILPNGDGYCIGNTEENHTDSKANEKYKMLTMIAMAKELIAQSKKSVENLPKSYTRDNVVLALGLPPEHMQTYKEEYKKYFVGRYVFTYANISFNLNVTEVMVFTQCLGAAGGYLGGLMKKHTDIYLIDIGGYTTDVLRIFNGNPDRNVVITDSFGVLHYYHDLRHTIATKKKWRLGNENFDHYFVETKKEDKPNDRCYDIYEETSKEYTDKMMSDLYSQGVRLESALPVFFGGGSKVFQTAIKNYFAESLPEAMFAPEFITDVKANAIGYKNNAEQILNKRYSQGQ